MGRKLRKHIKESGNAGQKTGFEDDSDEEQENDDEDEFGGGSGGDGGGIIGFFHRITHKRKDSKIRK